MYQGLILHNLERFSPYFLHVYYFYLAKHRKSITIIKKHLASFDINQFLAIFATNRLVNIK